MRIVALAGALLAVPGSALALRPRVPPDRGEQLARECVALRALGHLDEAVDACTYACLGLATHAADAALADVMWERDSFRDRLHAERIAERAFAEEMHDPVPALVYGRILRARNELVGLQRVVDRLRQCAPDAPETHGFAAILATANDEWLDAYREIEAAETAGLDRGEVAALRDALRARIPTWLAYAVLASAIAAGWVAAFVSLYVGGRVMSALTVRVARGLPPERSHRPHFLQRVLGRAYGALLRVACAFYFASIPLVVLLALLIFDGIALHFLVAREPPPPAVSIAFLVLLAASVAMGWGLRARDDDDPPGLRLDLARQPRLAALLADVARTVGTAPVVSVYLVPGMDVAVFEDGPALSRALGKRGERSLVLGLGFLARMSLLDFRCALAHEYGHFRDDDTAGGSFALAVRRSFSHTTARMRRTGLLRLSNPAWWFLLGFSAAFLRISLGASRLREVLADRWAAFAYGAAPVERGLRKTVAADAAFHVHVDTLVREALETRRGLANLYAAQPMARPDTAKIDAAVDTVLTAKGSPWEGHPSPLERIALVRTLAGTPTPEDDGTPALSLLDDRDELERRMTQAVCRNVADDTGLLITPDGVVALHGAGPSPA